MKTRGYSRLVCRVVHFQPLVVAVFIAACSASSTSTTRIAGESGNEATGGAPHEAGVVADAASPGVTTNDAASAASVRIFFVGNSYTHRNTMPGILAAFAESAGIPVQWDWYAQGGSTLAEAYDGLGRVDAPRPRMEASNWDVVVLQEQSRGPVGARDAYLQSVAKWSPIAQKSGAKVVLYGTWARLDSPDDQALLTDAFNEAGSLVSAKVAPAGEAWKLVLQMVPNLKLHQEDGSHPTIVGAYLTAATMYATVFRRSPVGLPARLRAVIPRGIPRYGQAASGDFFDKDVDIEAGLATTLQQLAWAVAQANDSSLR